MTAQKKHTKVDELLKAKFLGDVSFLLQASNPRGRAFLNYLQRVGRQLNIKDLDPHELISEATMRGLVYIGATSTGIDNPEAWFRKTCNYIMLDMVKDEKKNRLLKAKNQDSEQELDPIDEVELDEKKEFLKSKLPLLSEEDQKILDLKFYLGLSYKDIQRHYMDSEGQFIKIPALRQRESRALQRLRKQFSEKYGEEILA
jgi:RNA polymerase sigma factor (sigma-70 family)